MIFQCADLDRALQFPELMPDARAHAESCEHCREQLYLWTEISRVAPQLHEAWESPNLWARIHGNLTAAAPRRNVVPVWRWTLAAAAVVLLAVLLVRPWRQQSRQFLTDEALQQVQQAESTYARSIDKLSQIAGPALERSPSPLAGAYREKLLVLDSEIVELKATVEGNRYNVYLQTELASLYREKQKTLQEWLEYAKRNSSPLSR
jgi:hypothetical protein